MKKVGVVIPVINLWNKFTKPMLDSLKSKHDLYIVLVDNNSIDETYTEATKLISENFHYKRNQENWGCSKSWNYGLKDCFINHDCEYVFVINNDVLFHPNAIDNLVDRFERADESIVMVTCMNVRGDCKDIPSNIFTLNDKEYENTEESENPDFSGFMVNRKFFKEVGEIDEAYSEIGGAYFEDNDCHRRINLGGFKAIKCPPSLFYHFGSGSRLQGKISLPINMKFESNRDYFIGKWGGMPDVDGLWSNPFNDYKKDYKWTLQSEPKEVQDEIIAKFKKG